jgi:signal transduction histidine kinase/ligand-binding sensor domain-containing protein
MRSGCLRFISAASLQLLILLLAPTAQADSPWSVRTWQIPDGSTNAVNGIAQTPDGYLWIGTTAGLNQFDGLSFEHHTLGTPIGLPDSRVRELLPTRRGLWAAMDRSIVLLRPAQPPLVITKSVPPQRAESLIEDTQGALWVGYRGGPVCRIQDDKATVLNANDGIPMPTSAHPSWALDSHGQLWLAKSNHIGIIRDGKFEQIIETPGASFICAASDGGLWACCGFTLYKIDEQHGMNKLAELPGDHRGPDMIRLLEDRRHTLWVGTSSSGLFHYDGSTVQHVATPHAQANCLIEDREGNLWVGTDAGLDRVSPRAIEAESSDSEAPAVSIRSLCQAADGRIWAAMVNGSVAVEDHGRWQPPPFEFHDVACCIARGPDGAIWIGTVTQNRHLYCWRDGQLTVYGADQGLASHMITALLASSSGDLWIGSTAATSIQCLRNGQFFELKLPPGNGQVDALVEDHQGDIWIGRSWRGGLLRIHADQVINETPLSGEMPVHGLWVAPDDAVWLACYTRGLGRMKGGHFSLITSAQGLFQDSISQIVSDDHGALWLGCDQGIFKTSLHDLNDLADGKIIRINSIHYAGDEGLPPLQAKYGIWPESLRSTDGTLWMTMATTPVIVHPDRLREQLAPPPVNIARVVVDGKPIASAAGLFSASTNLPDTASTPLKLSPGSHRLEFDFSAAAFSAPEDVRFRYRLDDIDENWNEATEPRKAVYLSVPPGQYHFHVSACNADGMWNDAGSEVAVAIPQVVWQTWWFRAIGAGALFVMLLLIARYIAFRRLRRRVRELEQRTALDRERARIARDIHDDLGHGLTQIVLLSDLASHEQVSPDEFESQLKQIAGTAKQGIKSLDETVWAINPRNDTLPDVIDYLGQFVMQSVRSAGIRCELDLPDNPPPVPVASEVRHNLFLAVKEAVNNALRHARPNRVTLAIAVAQQQMIITIADDGIGFDPKLNGNGRSGHDGLANMKQRMLDIGGNFSVDSSPGSGTRISLTLQTDRPQRRALTQSSTNGNPHADHSLHR